MLQIRNFDYIGLSERSCETVYIMVGGLTSYKDQCTRTHLYVTSYAWSIIVSDTQAATPIDAATPTNRMASQECVRP